MNLNSYIFEKHTRVPNPRCGSCAMCCMTNTGIWCPVGFSGETVFLVLNFVILVLNSYLGPQNCNFSTFNKLEDKSPASMG